MRTLEEIIGVLIKASERGALVWDHSSEHALTTAAWGLQRKTVFVDDVVYKAYALYFNATLISEERPSPGPLSQMLLAKLWTVAEGSKEVKRQIELNREIDHLLILIAQTQKGACEDG